MRRLVLVRHARPLVEEAKPTTRWNLSDQGRIEAAALGRRLFDGGLTATVWTSPEAKARETADIAFPSITSRVREELGEVKTPWYRRSEDLVDAAHRYLKREPISAWEPRQGVLARLGSIEADLRTVERVVIVSTVC